jgi:hypothetical protein
MLSDYSNYLWIGLLIFILARMILPIFGNVHYKTGEKLTPEEEKEFDNLRSHNITLASFTITLIAIIFAFNNNQITNNVNSLLYFSISLICFFNASYFSLFRMNPIYWYVGDTIEMTGILSLGLGFLLLISKEVNSFELNIVYIIFLISLSTLSIVGIILYKDHFFAKRT